MNDRRRNSPKSDLQWFRLFIALTLLLLGIGCERKREFSDGVRLMWTGEYVEPSTTLELRFNETMVPAEEVGLPAKTAPLQTKPHIDGSFVWLSRQSGVFVPTEPYRLNTTYTASLIDGLAREDGKPSKARLLRKLKTPPFECKLQGYNYFDPTNAVSRPHLDLAFNARIETNGAGANIFFMDAAGRRIQAKLQFSESDISSYGLLDEEAANNPVLTWQQRFMVARPKHGVRKSKPENSEKSIVKAVNRVAVEPTTFLPEGKGWRLVVAKGLASTDPGLSLNQSAEFTIGNVNPFIVLYAAPSNGIDSGTQIQLTFNKPISPGITASNASEWIEVSPAPSDLKIQPNWQGIELTGSFRLNENYRVRLKSGFPSAEEGFVLSKPFVKDFVFEPIQPRLAFPSFSADQLAAGGRKVELLSVNVQNMRLRAKILDEHTVIHGLRGYRSYLTGLELNPAANLVNFSGVPGRTIFETNLEARCPIDETFHSVISWDNILKDRQYGVVFLEAERIDSTNKPVVQSILQLTDLGLLWKQNKDRLWVYSFSYKTGRPMADIPIQLMSDENEPLAMEKSDAGGIVEFDRKPPGQWLLARNGEDMHAVNIGSWEGQLSAYGFGFPIQWNDAEPGGKLMILSDRPLYRPSELFYCKLIAREWSDSGFAIPDNRTVAVKCYDSRAFLFYETNMTLSAMGSADFSMVLPEASLGYFRVQASITNTAESVHFFQVRDYRPKAFELLAQAKPAYAAGETIQIPVDARYYFGQRLTKAKLHWSLTASDTAFAPAGYEEYSFSPSANLAGMPQADSSYFSQGDTSLEKGGTLTPEIPVDTASPQPRTVNMLLECTDLNQQTVSHHIGFLRHSSDFYLGLKPDKSIPSAGKPVRVAVAAVSTNGASQAARARFVCRKVEWAPAKIQGASGSVLFQNEIQFKDVLKKDLDIPERARPELGKSKIAEALASDKTDNSAFEFTPAEAGVYLVEAETEDAQNRKVKAAIAIYVSGAEQAAWSYRSEKRVELIADRDVFAPGDTAKILVKTPIEGLAMVTIERDSVMRSFTTNLTGSAPLIEIPLTETDAPNVFVSVFLLRGAEASTKQFKAPESRLGYCQLVVQSVSNALDMIVNTDSTHYQPGKSVHVETAIRDHGGTPVPNAEVTLFAVDEGVISLMEDNEIDPIAFFYAARPLAVHSGCSISRLVPEDPEQLRFQNKGTVIGDGAAAALRLRKNFQACAFWTASFLSDAAGKVQAVFTAPDNLTRFRIVAVAHTEKSQFGKGQAAIEINKPLQVEPVLPRFACVDDKIDARAVVHNNTGTGFDVVVDLALDGKAAIIGGLSKTNLHVNPHSAAAATFSLNMTAPGSAVWQWRVVCADAAAQVPGDWTQSILPIQEPAPNLREVYTGRSTNGATNLLAQANPQLLEGKGAATVRVSSSRLAEIGEAVSDLFQYPYGCMEQTCSSLIPWLTLQDSDMRKLAKAGKPHDIPAIVRAGVRKIFTMQTASGGLAYWPGNREPVLWCGAYGAMTLALAKKAGYPVPTPDYDRLLNWLAKAALEKTSDPDETSSDLCLTLYALALAGKPEPSLNELMFRKQSKLSAENKALLALAIQECHGSPDMIAPLLEKGGKAGDDPWYGCPARELALQLLALLSYRPGDDRVEVLLEDLIRSRQNGAWQTTQGNAWAVLTLTEYVRRIETATKTVHGSLKQGDITFPFNLEPNSKQFQVVFEIAGRNPSPTILLENPGQAKLFVQTTVDVVAAHKSATAQSKGFAIARHYSVVDDDGVIQDWVKPRVGARVLVDLMIELTQPAHFVAVEDRLPSILEPIQPEFASQQTHTGTNNLVRWTGDYQEFRADRALYFCDHLAPGRYSIRYLARVLSSGTVSAPPAKVVEMYHPDRFGTTPTETLTSLPLE